MDKRASLVVASALVLCAAVASGRAKHPCAADLAHCPDCGCAAPGTPEGLLNQAKRHAVPVANAVVLTFADLQALQGQATKLVGQGQPLTAADRAKLKTLTVNGKTVGEGAAVRIAGYLVGKPHANLSGESVNCRLPTPANNDFHLTIAPAPNDTEYQGIVVEMIPQGRPAAWNLAAIKKIEAKHQMVLVSGQLFYDNAHAVNANPNAPSSNEPKRFSLWEVHPIVEFAVCGGGTCDPAKPLAWQALK